MRESRDFAGITTGKFHADDVRMLGEFGDGIGVQVYSVAHGRELHRVSRDPLKYF